MTPLHLPIPIRTYTCLYELYPSVLIPISTWMGSTVWTEPSCHSGAEDPGAAILALFISIPSLPTGLNVGDFSFIPSYTYLHLYLPIPTYISHTHPYTPIRAEIYT